MAIDGLTKREFLTAQEVAYRLGRSVRFVYNQLRSRKLKAHRIGGQWGISQSQYDAYVASCKTS